MVKISFSNIQSGMVLANDVLNSKDMILLRSGSEISEKDIRIFKMWGIDEIEIQEPEEIITCKITDKYNPQLINEVEKEVKQIFVNTNLNHPAMNKLYQQCMTRKIEKKLKG